MKNALLPAALPQPSLHSGFTPTIFAPETPRAKVVTPWSTVGFLTFKRTYARNLLDLDGKPTGDTEEFEDVVERVLTSARDQLKVGFTGSEEDRLREYMLLLKASPAGRFLWQMGTNTVDRLGLASLQNCAFVVVDHPITPFTWAMDMLLLGSGVGFNIQRCNVDKIPAVHANFKAPVREDTDSADHIVPDTREGWVKLLGKVLKSAFFSGEQFTYSTLLIRSKGAPIKGFGGTSSGPEDLCLGMQQISDILLNRVGQKLRPVDCLDIMNIIGSIVVAGNVRRSAQIAIGDPDDLEYLSAKRWDLGDIPAWRSCSNNSVACDDMSQLHPSFWDGYMGQGEPYGLINLNLSRQMGRLGETQYPDPGVEGYNPCAEQGLANGETCCLAEAFLPNIQSQAELIDICILLYRLNKHSLLLHCHQKLTEDIVHKNMRMGIGLTGILQASEEQISWLDGAYKALRQFDVDYSALHGIEPSIKLTTVKPSGTLSLLPGVTPGVHPGYAQHMIRRIRIASHHPLVETCKAHGYPVEYVRRFDGSDDHSTVVVSFPFSYPEGTKLAADMTAITQLEAVRRMQTLWSDNSVSCTVYYRKEELPAIQEWLAENYSTQCKSLSFLLHSDHGFDQAPYEEITRSEYDALVAKTTIISSIARAGDLGLGTDECTGGACPVR